MAARMQAYGYGTIAVGTARAAMRSQCSPCLALWLTASIGLLLSGCFLIDFAPTVSLSVAGGVTTVESGAVVTILADGFDLNGDSLSFLWLVDGKIQDGETGKSFQFSRKPARRTSYSIVVQVSDRSGNGKAGIAVTVMAEAVSCDATAETTPWVSGAYSGGMTYTLDVGSTARDVYFVFTNAALTAAGAGPSVGMMPAGRGPGAVAFTATRPSARGGIRGKPEISEFNRTANRYFHSRRAAKGITARSRSVVDDVFDFFDDSTSNTIPATCRRIVGPVTGSVSGTARTLYVWVADDCWDGAKTDKLNKVTQPMVDALAVKFLDSNSTTGEDVYHWVTNIYGEEWASKTEPGNLPGGLIPADDSITILLCDIDQDNSEDGGTIGYFWAKDNMTQSAVDYSNERVMFHIDAVMFANPHQDADNSDLIEWSIDSYWPGETVSTLAHEFQHMIGFYQKEVLLDTAGEDTWIDEMSSQVTEDLVADKLHIIGPRGIAYTDGSAGSPKNEDGRFPMYNAFGYMRLVEWQNDNHVLVNYSNSYAFGAYLARNYGGAALFRGIMHNGYSDTQAVTQAVKDASGQDLAFTELLRRWGAATLLSDMTGLPAGLLCTYNTGGWIRSKAKAGDAISYNLGSINLYHYKYVDTTGNFQDGPLLWDESTGIPAAIGVGGACNLFYRADTGITGSRTWPIDIPDGFIMTVVVR